MNCSHKLITNGVCFDCGYKEPPLKYRLNYNVGGLRFSVGCLNELAVLKEIIESDPDSYLVSEYTGERIKPNGLKELILEPISNRQFFKNLIAATFNKSI